MHPVSNVTWQDAQQYVVWLSAVTGQRYRLLTEAEWEYAARAGSTAPYPTGNTISQADARFDHQYGPASIGSFAPNGFGLHDMHGNVWEWVQDCYAAAYSQRPVDLGNCTSRAIRGGGWTSSAAHLRSASRHAYQSDFYAPNLGFRVARELD